MVLTVPLIEFILEDIVFKLLEILTTKPDIEFNLEDIVVKLLLIVIIFDEIVIIPDDNVVTVPLIDWLYESILLNLVVRLVAFVEYKMSPETVNLPRIIAVP